MSYKVGVVTGTRAEYGVLRELLFKLKSCAEIDFKLIVTGAHLSKRFGNTVAEIEEDGFKDYIKVPIPIEDDSKEGIAKSTGVAITAFAEVFSDYKPQLLVLLGDRYEIYAAGSAAFLLNIPIAHISGGDVTEGAIDDTIRHCLTKMSSIHFPGCEQSAKRIVQMGEQPDRVFNVGEPGVENCIKADLYSRVKLAESLNVDWVADKDYAVVTFHPVTREDGTAQSQVYELIKAMDEHNEFCYIITMANADAGGRLINDIWISEGKKRDNWLVVTSLGAIRYLSAVKYAKLVIGNSSSGIIEAPSLKTPTVNVGDRQKGRMMADSIVCCEPIECEIVRAIDTTQTLEFTTLTQNVESPFGDGTTSDRILEKILEVLHSGENLTNKHFFDTNC